MSFPRIPSVSRPILPPAMPQGTFPPRYKAFLSIPWMHREPKSFFTIRALTLFPFSSQHLRTLACMMPLLFQSRVKGIVPLKITGDARWQHTQASLEEEPKTEKDERESKRQELYREIIRFLLSVSSVTIVGAVSTIFIMMYNDPPEWDKWRERYKELKGIRELEKELKHLNDARKILYKMEELRRLIGDGNMQDILDGLIKDTEQKHERDIDDLNQKKHRLESELEGYKNRILDTEQKHKRDIDDLNQKKHRLESELEESRNKVSALEREIKEKENLIFEYGKLKDDYFVKLQNEIEKHKEGADKLLSIIELYKQCPSDEWASLNDLHKFFLAKKEVKFEKDHRFGSLFITHLLKQALHRNINDSVTHLNFYGTYIKEDDGLEHLMEGLKNNHTIQSLDLGYTAVTHKHVEAIADMLRYNRTLQTLSLYYAYIDDGDIMRLETILKDNKVLKTLDLRDTYVSDKKKQELKSNLKIEVY